jgi:small subunit ribosomal protein S13
MTLLNSTLDSKARVHSALTQVQGIGPSVAAYLCNVWGIGYDLRVSDLSSSVRAQRARELEQGIRLPAVEGKQGQLLRLGKDCRRVVEAAVFELQRMDCYRGVRHREGLPCHGQRTRTNGSKRLRVAKLKALHSKRLGSKKGGSKRR